MLTKLGYATAGMAVGLVALAPMAAANEDHKHHPDADSGRTCTTTGGEASAISDIAGSAPAAVAQAPVGGSVTGNVECSDVLSNNDNNFSQNFNDNDDNRFG